MSQEKSNVLAILCIEKNIIEHDLKTIISDFTS